MYKITPNHKWIKKAASLEGGHDISAGVEVGGLLDIKDDKGQIDLSKLMTLTGAGMRELADMLGMSMEEVRDDKAGPAAVKNSAPLIRALGLLAELCDDDRDRMRAWLTEPKVYWGGLRPLDMLLAKRGEAVVETLKAIKEGEAPVGG